jgi:predicted DNA-binding transcriptional regulator AlpA
MLVTNPIDKKAATVERIASDMPARGPDAFSIAEFCASHGISKSTFHKLRRDGKAPRVMRVGSRVLISIEAAAEWRRERELEALPS